jgi:hypothetical protein
VQVDPAALELELIDLALAVLLAPSLEGEYLQVAGKVLQLGQQFSYRHALTVARQARYVVGARGGRLDRPDRDRAWNRAGRACAVCAPPTVEPRTPRTPL